MVYLIIFICLLVGCIGLGIANVIVKRKRKKLENKEEN